MNMNSVEKYFFKNQLNVPECDFSTLEKSHKKKKQKKCKEIKIYDVSVEHESSQEPTSNVKEGFFSKKDKLKGDENCEKRVIPYLQPEPDGIVIPYNICQQKKRKRNRKELSVSECDTATSEVNHEKKAASVSVSEANSCKLDENDLGTKENGSSIILDNFREPEELKNSEVSIDYKRIRKPKKRKRNLNGPKYIKVLECENILKNSHEKEIIKTASLSVLDAKFSDCDALIDGDYSSKENNSIILDDIEEPVDFQIPPLHVQESLKTLTKEDKNLFKSQGVEIKLGKFSCSEDAILKTNYKEFCSTFKVNDPCLLLGIGRNKKPETAVLNFLKAKHFYLRLGKNLNNRTLYSVYQRARILFNPFRASKINKCNEKEIKEVLHYQKKFGNNWHQIGALVEKTNLKVRKCFEWNSEDIKKGDWTPEEEEILINAIHSLVKIPNLSGRHSNLIPWSKVADLVPTRNTSQCRLHWGEFMAWEPDAKRKPWSTEKDVELVDELISRRNIIVNEIDWKDVHEMFKDFAPSYMFLRKRFRKLKTKKKFRYILKKSGLPIEE